MTKHRSIGERLSRAKTIAVKQEVAQDWATSWRAEHDLLFAQIEQAIKRDDYDSLCISVGQLKVVNGKKFTALPGVITKLAGGVD